MIGLGTAHRQRGWSAAGARRLLTGGPALVRADIVILGTIGIAALAVRALPVLAGGGLRGLLGYDDGVYFSASIAWVNGLMPYRDFLLLHPPGIVVLLSPFAALGGLVGDPTSFALARAVVMLLGALNAVLAGLVVGQHNRLAGVVAAGLYAVWNTTGFGERTTDLHAPQHTLLLLGLLVLAGPGVLTVRRAALAGVLTGLATSIQLWQGVTVLVVLWWVLVRAHGPARHRLRILGAGLLGAGLAFLLVCAPFLLAAPEVAVRHTLLNQLGRPDMGIGIAERLFVLEAGARRAELPRPIRSLVPDPLVIAAAVAGLVLILAAARRYPWARLWVILAIVQTAVVLVTPSFLADYVTFPGPAAALSLAAAIALVEGHLRSGRLRTFLYAGVTGVGLLLGGASIAFERGQEVPVLAIERDLSDAHCVASDSPSLLVLTSTARRNIERGCALVVDPTGVSYDADRGRPYAPGQDWRLTARGYQEAMRAWYTSGDAALFVRGGLARLAPSTEDAIRRHLPVERRRGPVTVRLATPG